MDDSWTDCIVNEYISKGVCPTNQLRCGETILTYSCASTSLDVVSLLGIPSANNIINKRNMIGQTPLCICLSSGNFDVSETLISMGCSLERDDDELKSTPLHHACGSGLRESVQYLSKIKNQNKPDTKGYLPIHYAAENDNWDCVDVMYPFHAKQKNTLNVIMMYALRPVGGNLLHVEYLLYALHVDPNNFIIHEGEKKTFIEFALEYENNDGADILSSFGAVMKKRKNI